MLGFNSARGAFMQMIFDEEGPGGKELALLILSEQSAYVLAALDGINRVHGGTIYVFRETLPHTLTRQSHRVCLGLFGAQSGNSLLEFLLWILFVVHLSSPSGECQVILLQVSARAMQQNRDYSSRRLQHAGNFAIVVILDVAQHKHLGP